MSKRPQESRRRIGKDRLAAFLLSLLPSAMILGLLAPGLVETRLVAAQSRVAPLEAPRVAWQPRHLKMPLLLPSELVSSHELPLADVAGLLARFARALAADPPGADEADAESFPGLEDFEDESIVIDDVDDSMAAEIFENSLAPSLEVIRTDPWPDYADVIPFNFEDFVALGGFTQFDDFVGRETRRGGSGGTPVIPEPGTAVLLGLGLVVLALRRRRA